MKSCLLVLLGLYVMVASTDAGELVTITFSPTSLPGGQKRISRWNEHNVQFSTPNGMASNDTSSTGYPYNGSTYLQLLAADAPLTISTTNSSPFRISSIDLAEYSTVYASPKTVTFVGHFIGGDTVSTTFVTDGTIDGNGPLTDFQTFYFPASFTNLTSVTTDSPLLSLDNVVMTLDNDHPAFFAGEQLLSDGVYFLNFPNGNCFGYYSYLTDPSYVYHFDLGYEYVFDAMDGKGGVYFYDFKMHDFFYTSPTFPFPYLYSFGFDSVVYYYPDPSNIGRYNTNGVRYFYVFKYGEIIAL